MIRLAQPDDADVMRHVVHAAYRHYTTRIGKPPGPMLDDYAQCIAAGQAWVLEDGGDIRGILVLKETPDKFLLDNIAVPPEWQGKGYGRVLIEFAEAEALRRGFTEITLYTHEKMTENIALYTRVGFAETHRISEKGYDRVYMTKPLE